MKVIKLVVLAFFICYFLEGVNLVYKYNSAELWLIFYVLSGLILALLLEPEKNE